MALYTSAIFSAASGSLAGITFSHNKGGNYVRARAIPTNPNTQPQQDVKALLAFYSSNWKALTEVQRDAWDDYAQMTPLTNALGNEYFASGQNMYVRTNVFRVSAGLAAESTAPPSGGLATFTAPTSVAAVGTTNLVTGAVTATDPWAISSTGALIISGSRPLSAGIGSSKQNVRIAGVLPGATGSAPTSFSVSLPFLVVAGQKVAVAFRVVDGQGRLSPLIRSLLLVA